MATEPMVPLEVSIPEWLGEQVNGIARTDNVTLEVLVQKTLENMVRKRRLQRHYDYGEERARAAGLNEADVARLIEEVRSNDGSRGQ